MSNAKLTRSRKLLYGVRESKGFSLPSRRDRKAPGYVVADSLSRHMRNKVIVVLGPTASGKSALAVKLARRFNGEVVSADSRQVYRGLDIGTGKITKLEMKGVRHHLLDVADPRKQFTVVPYMELAQEAVRDILSRGKLPIICGGTGFYISALLGEQPFADVPPNAALRKRLGKISAPKLFSMLTRMDPKRAKRMNESDRKNPRRLIRAIEILHAQNDKMSHTHILRVRAGYGYSYTALKIGITLPDKKLRKRITIRLFARIRGGMIAEARRLHKQGLSWKRMDELGLEYRYLARYLQGKLTKQEMLKQLETEIWHYAKRQMTWFKRDKFIHWFNSPNDKKIFILMNKKNATHDRVALESNG